MFTVGLFPLLKTERTTLLCCEKLMSRMFNSTPQICSKYHEMERKNTLSTEKYKEVLLGKMYAQDQAFINYLC